MLATAKPTCPPKLLSKASPSYSIRRRRALLLKATTTTATTNGSQRIAVSPSLLSKARRLALASGPGFSTLSNDHEAVSASRGFARVQTRQLSLNTKSHKNVCKGPGANISFARRFPDKLRRPRLNEMEECNVPALESIGYGDKLTEIGLHAVLDEIRLDGVSLFRAVTDTTIPATQPVSSKLPDHITISLPASVRPEHRPTHMLAAHTQTPVYIPSKNDLQQPRAAPVQAQRTVTVYPIHAQMLAARCPRVPALPVQPTFPFKTEQMDEDIKVDLSSASTTNEPKVTLTVPLVPFAIPSPSHFGHLLQLLYTHSIPAFLSLLIPFEPARSYAGLHKEHDPLSLAAAIAGHLSGEEIVERMRIVYGIWMNCASLGVRDESVWRAIEVAWTGYREGLMMADR